MSPDMFFNEKAVLRPTGYDKAILMAKWGEKNE